MHHVKRYLFLTAMTIGVVMALPANAIEGVYNTGVSDDEGDQQSLDVKFHPCEGDAALTCATVIHVRNMTDPLVLPDDRPVIGFTMIKNLKKKGDGRYRKGRINAVDESIRKGKMKWYGVKVDTRDDGALEVRGCVANVCPRTMVWTPVDAASVAETVSSVGDDATPEEPSF